MTPGAARVRVVHLGPEAPGRGGMGLSILGLLHSPLAERYEMKAIATWSPTAGALDGAMLFARALASLVRWCAVRRKGIVHVHAAVRGSWYRKAVCVSLAKLLRRPVVLQIRSGPGDIVEFDARLGPVRRAMFRLLFALPNEVVSVSQAGADEIERRYGRERIVVVSNPAPPVSAAAPPSTAERPTLLYVGGFADPAKGGEVMIEALPAILDAHPGTQVVLAGPGEPPPAAARVIDDRDHVSWLGWLDDAAKAKEFARADVFVLPSLSEGMPNAMLEAMANRRAVVATRVGGVPDVITDGEDGLMVPAGQAAPLARAAGTLLSDPDLRSRLAEAAGLRAERLTRDEVWGRLDSIYKAIA